MYEIETSHQAILHAAQSLLTKIARSDLPSSVQRLSLAKAMVVLSRIPEVTEDICVSVTLCGPRRQFGEHEIWHWWKVEVEPDGYIFVTASGHFYRPSTGGDTFLAMRFCAPPDDESQCSDYLHTLALVDDAKPFCCEVDEIDMNAPGYSLEIDDADNEFLGEFEEDEEDADENEEPESESALCENIVDSPYPEDAYLSTFVDAEEANRRQEYYADPPETCDVCQGPLKARQYFVDGLVPAQRQWNNMCSSCFQVQGGVIAWGYGQLYRQTDDGRWQLVAGFPAAEPAEEGEHD